MVSYSSFFLGRGRGERMREILDEVACATKLAFHSIVSVIESSPLSKHLLSVKSINASIEYI